VGWHAYSLCRLLPAQAGEVGVVAIQAGENESHPAVTKFDLAITPPVSNQWRLRELSLKHAGEVRLICAHDAVEFEACAAGTPLLAGGRGSCHRPKHGAAAHARQQRAEYNGATVCG
jgi:hypothetical protein